MRYLDDNDMFYEEIYLQTMPEVRLLIIKHLFSKESDRLLFQNTVFVRFKEILDLKYCNWS